MRLIQRFVDRLPVDDEAGGRGPGYNPRLGGYQPGEDSSLHTRNGSDSSI